jgi:hypothetical protein
MVMPSRLAIAVPRPARCFPSGPRDAGRDPCACACKAREGRARRYLGVIRSRTGLPLVIEVPKTST